MGIPLGKLTGNPNENSKKTSKGEDLVHHILHSQQGSSFQRLMSGDFSAYPSQSEADAALCMILAFWTRKDSLKIDEIFRSSQLMRDKWDRKHSKDGRTYGQMTIDSAILKCNWVYTDAITRVFDLSTVIYL